MSEYTVYVHIDPEGKRYYGATMMDVKKRWKYGYRNNKKYRIQDRVSIDVTEY